MLSSERTEYYRNLVIDTKTKEFEKLANTYYYGFKRKGKYCGRGIYISDTTLLYGYFNNGEFLKGIGIEFVED